jgi:hypothetical protein
MHCCECLDCWSGGGWGVFIASNHQFNRWEGCCRWTHRTVWCATGHCSVCQPRHPTVRVLTVSTVGDLSSCGTRQFGAAPDRHCSLSGAPSGGCSDSARTVRALCVVRRPLESTVALASRCSAGAPDSPVNYSEARPHKLEGEELESIAPGAPDTVRWHTGQSGAPDQCSLWFLLLLSFEP